MAIVIIGLAIAGLRWKYPAAGGPHGRPDGCGSDQRPGARQATRPDSSSPSARANSAWRPVRPSLVEGTAEYNVEALKPEIITDGANVEIKQDDLLNLVEPRGVKSKWDFKLGSSPMDLSINAGAYEGDFELGGLSLTGLTVKDGAASRGPVLQQAESGRYDRSSAMRPAHPRCK